jgi:hypothetical protein
MALLLFRSKEHVMEPQYHERGAAQAAAETPRPSPQTCPPQSGSTSWKAVTKDPSPEVKLTGDGQIVEAGYGHGV